MRGLLLLMGAVTFALMGYDKHQAKKGGRRVPERVLFLCAALGGGLGGLIGMQAFRHKTRHWYFAVGFTLLTALQLALALWLHLRRSGV